MNASSAIRSVGLVAVGAVIGVVTGLLVASDPDGRRAGGSGPGSVSDLEDRVARIEAQAQRGDGARRGRQRVSAGDDVSDAAADWGAGGLGAASPGPSDPDSAEVGALGSSLGGDDGDSRRVAAGDVVPVEAPPEFVNLVRSAIDEIKRQDQDASLDKRVANERQKYMREVDKKLHNYRDMLGMNDEQVAAFRSVAERGVDARLDGQKSGLPREELEALDRARHREFRDVLGGDGYREFRKLELDAVARPTIVSIAGQAGVDREQRDRIERLLDEHIEGLVDLDVKLRTEELEQEERSAIHKRMQDANKTAWDRLRGSILDAEQRERVPKRLR